MFYSDINEAYDGSIKKQLDTYNDQINIIKTSTSDKDSLFDAVQNDRDEIYKSLNIDPNNIKNIKKNICEYPASDQAYFTAQGNLMGKKKYTPSISRYSVEQTNESQQESDNFIEKGTAINDLIRDNVDNSDSYSTFDDLNSQAKSDFSFDTDIRTDFSDADSILEPKKNKNNNNKYYDHDYFINKFISDIYNQNDTSSLVSSQSNDDNIYHHIKKCNYCKDKIKEKLTIHKPEPLLVEKFTTKQSIPETSTQEYNIKETMIIILIGIIVILFLDFFMKIFKCI